MANAKFIDISYCQPVAAIDWNRLKAQGITAIIRAGQNNYEDNLFREHYARAIAAGIRPGMYWFYEPKNRPEYQAEACILAWKSLNPRPKVIALDVENIAYGTINILPNSVAEHTTYLRYWLQRVEKETEILPVIYTRADYWDAWVERSTEWAHYPLWIASWTNYSVNVRLPKDWIDWQLWQYEGGSGRTDGVIGPVDQNEFNGDLNEMNKFFGAEEATTMTTLYKTSVPQSQRARVLTLAADTRINCAYVSMGIDAVILPMGGMDKWDGSHMLVYPEETFKGRTREFVANGIPVIGRFALDAGLWLKEQHTAAEVDRMVLRDNFVLGKLIDAWHVGAWNWDGIISKMGKWEAVSAIELSMVEVDGYPGGTYVSDDWQARTLLNVINHLKYLMDNGMAPNIPIILRTGPWFLDMYKNGRLAQEITNRKSWLWLNLGQWTLSSTATFPSLDSIFLYPPKEAFKFSTIPDGYFDRIILHEFTGEKQKCSQIVDINGNPAPVSLSLWNDTRAAALAFLGSTIVPPPVVTPPVSTIEALQLENVQLKSKIATWRAWYDAAPKG